ncbi:hypothetical protein PG326_07085 [Riemerella anatipestifer]|nr:hypothetical protein [Riemerella anatipestifer]MDY3358093.1 hypothetical protein [Riemerella anatipestifer]
MIDYAKGFEILAQIHDSLYHTNISGRKHMEKLLELSKVKDIDMSAIEAKPYVDFGIHSQTITEKNGDKWVVFPRIQDGMVKDLVCGVLSDEETQVHYYVLKRDTEFYKNSIGLFQNAYIEKYAPAKKALNSSQKFLELGICTKKGNFFDNCNIPIVILPPPPPKGGGNGSSSGGGGGGLFSDGWFSSGGGSGRESEGEGGRCSKYDMCIPDFTSGDGAGPPPPNHPTDPCEKAKTQITNNTEAQKAVGNLREHLKSGVGGEKGWLFPSEGGAAKPTTENHNHSVNLGPPSEIEGAYHNHTGSGVNIFSASDVASLIEIARYRGTGNREDAFMGMVAPGDIHYLIRFTGKENELPSYGSYSPEMLKELNEFQWDFYVKTFSKSNLTKEQRLEQTLFKTLEKMGLKNRVTLQRIDKNNNVSTISQNQNGTINVTPC